MAQRDWSSSSSASEWRWRPRWADAINTHIDSICDGLRPWSTGGCYFNFADRPTELDKLYDADTLARLREVKERYDPDGVSRAGAH